MLKVVVIVPESSLSVVSGRGLGWILGVVSPNFSFAMAWIGLGQSVAGLGRAGSKKMDPWTTLICHSMPW